MRGDKEHQRQANALVSDARALAPCVTYAGEAQSVQRGLAAMARTSQRCDATVMWWVSSAVKGLTADIRAESVQ